MPYFQAASFSELMGKTLVSIQVSPDEDEIFFTTNRGEVYRMYHEQDCCEWVTIEDMNGDIESILQ